MNAIIQHARDAAQWEKLICMSKNPKPLESVMGVTDAEDEMVLGPVVGVGPCDWCGTKATLVEHELQDQDIVHLCSVCSWLDILNREVKDATDIGKDMA